MSDSGTLATSWHRPEVRISHAAEILVKSRSSAALLVCVLLAPLTEASLFAQNKVEPVMSPLPSRLEATQPPPAARISLGQTEEEAIRIMGRPTQHVLKHVIGGDMADIWELSPQDTLVVTFRKNAVKSFRHIYSQPALQSAPAGAEIGLGQQNSDGTWSARPDRPAAAEKVTLGQAKEEVLRILGPPNGGPPSQRARDSMELGASIGVWALSPQDTLVVEFRGNVVGSVWHEVPAGSNPSRANAVAGKVVDVAASVYLTRVCPAVYRKPALFMTAADLRVLQACDASGFMLFGVYLYTGVRQ